VQHKRINSRQFAWPLQADNSIYARRISGTIICTACGDVRPGMKFIWISIKGSFEILQTIGHRRTFSNVYQEKLIAIGYQTLYPYPLAGYFMFLTHNTNTFRYIQNDPANKFIFTGK